MSIRLYVGNLPKEIERQELEAVFADCGTAVTTKVIKDRKTGKCRGFGFVTVKNDEEADKIIEQFNGHIFQDSALKIEKALPRAKKKNETESEEPAPRPTTNKAAASSSSSSSASASSSARRGGNNNKNRRNTQAPAEPEAIQPDPRWAADLEKLKKMLAAQATNP
jgi:RNA recognition motif-containing protein